MALYEVAVLGDPTEEQVDLLTAGLKAAANDFQLTYGTDLLLHIIDPAMKCFHAA